MISSVDNSLLSIPYKKTSNIHQRISNYQAQYRASESSIQNQFSISIRLASNVSRLTFHIYRLTLNI